MTTQRTADFGPEPHSPEVKRIHLKDIAYILVDDDEDTRIMEKMVLAGRMDMENIQGSFSSAEEALERIQECIEAGHRVDLVVLDKEFYVDAENSRLHPNAALEFLKMLEEYKKTLSGEQHARVQNIRSAMISGSVRPEDLEQLQAVSPSFMGIIKKPSADFNYRIAGMLAREGIVIEDNPNVQKGLEILEADKSQNT